MLTVRISQEAALPDNDQWQFRFKIKSESSNRKYVISQNKKGRFWGCSCPGWKKHRHCKHLRKIGLPGDQAPMDVNLVKI